MTLGQKFKTLAVGLLTQALMTGPPLHYRGWYDTAEKRVVVGPKKETDGLVATHAPTHKGPRLG